MPSVLAQGNSTCYEPPAINFHLGETPPREPQGGGERTECAALLGVHLTEPSLVELCAHHHEGHLAAVIGVAPGVPASDLHHHVAGLERALPVVGDQHALAGN